MYNDSVDDPAILRRIAEVAPPDSAAHGAASALARALVLQDRPGVVAIRHQADWIAGLLAGKPLPSDESNALKTGYDPVARRWPSWIAETGMATGCCLASSLRGRPPGILRARSGFRQAPSWSPGSPMAVHRSWQPVPPGPARA